MPASTIRFGAICLYATTALCVAACAACVAACAAAPAHPTVPSAAAGQHDAAAQATPQTAALTKAAGHWARRADRAELEKAIAILTDAAAIAEPTDARALAELSHAHYLMGQSILAFGWADGSEAARHFGHGAASASHALIRVAPQVASALQAQRAPAPSELQTPEQGALAYWLAANWRADAELAGMPDIVLREAPARSLLVRATELSPNIDQGGAYRLLAELYAHPSHASMRDLSAARTALERALASSSSDLRNKHAYVEHYAVPAQDAASATTRLREALGANAVSAEDRIAQAHAKRVAAAIDGSLE
jgi:hypothetical protein